MSKKTVVLGASTNPSRYAYKAVMQLKERGHEIVPIGIKEGEGFGSKIILGTPEIEDVHTITLYLNPSRQKAYYDYMIELQPERIIFNPGTENPELYKLAKDNNIEIEIGCTLVMLSIGNY